MIRPGMGAAALVLVLGTIGAALAGLIAAAGPTGAGMPWNYFRHILLFTAAQASLSTLLSVLFGAALALALSRRRFPGRGALIAAMNLATVLPAIVAVFAIVAVYGRSGWLGFLGELGLPVGRDLYGLSGILIAHVFFNMPLAARVFLAALAAVPGEHWRLAGHLGMRPESVFRLIDRPILRREAPAVAALVFLLCFTSFAVVLALGGGPAAATLEVAIYEAVRFEADFGRAAGLAILQILICLALAGPAVWLAGRPGESPTFGNVLARPDRDAAGVKAIDAAILAVSGAFLLPPIAATVAAGLPALRTLVDPAVAQAAATSFAIALPAGVLAVGLAIAIADLARRLRLGSRRPALAGVVGTAGTAILAVPPVALSAGLFVLLRPVADPFALAVPLIVLVNALMALPFALRQVEPPLTLSAERYGRLADSLGISGRNRLRLVDWPLLATPAKTALIVAVALSLGDLGVAAFFGSSDLVTLPLLLHQRMGAYRMEEAASLALLLAALIFALFALVQRPAGAILARNR